ncbi:hypothetical protein BJY01DRAFT_214766 [Aspergillus pseudoustus]|uniref:Uncharacterized protein n=1 Tax=Aspergillus pseudoustus TaxID=1810923 RepID=A0ABR4JYX2_9EURO
MDAGSLVIGHFREETGSSITLESETATTTRIIEIVHSRKSPMRGLDAIKDALMVNGVSQANIKESVHTSGLSTVGSKGKIIVTWEPWEKKKGRGGGVAALYPE